MKIIKGDPTRMGVTRLCDGYNFAVNSKASEIVLCLYSNSLPKRKTVKVKLDTGFKTGDVFACKITDGSFAGWEYNYCEGDRYFADPYGKTFSGNSEFGSTKKEKSNKVTSLIELEAFDWEDDKHPLVSYDDAIIYKLHVRGYTKHKSSGVSKRGTFAGLIEKIPYIKALGINVVELMPAYDFTEFKNEIDEPNAVFIGQRSMNYWGYTGGNYFAPKASYTSCAGERKDYTCEFKQLVKEFHKAGIEVVMEMFFEHVTPGFVNDCVKYWVTEYHIDGIHYYGERAGLEMLAKEPMLSNTKIFTVYWDGEPVKKGNFKNMASYNEGFLINARKFLKGDDDQLGGFMRLLVANPNNGAVINYITNHNGFCLNDLVSYEYKHNEANNEGNRDGEDYNYSWNCGEEGVSRKKRINKLRMSQMKNAMMLVLLSQGTPLILAGDEICNTQKGNNNPYCQDNEIGWVVWKNSAVGEEMLKFTKQLIAYRKNNKILHMPSALSQSDYLACDFPDLSFHGDNAWVNQMLNYMRYAGVLYCCRYADPKDEGRLIYVAYNMHWEKHLLALPKAGTKCEWKVILSSKPDENVEFSEDLKQVKVADRSIVVLECTFVQEKQDKTIKPKTKKIENKENNEKN